MVPAYNTTAIEDKISRGYTSVMVGRHLGTPVLKQDLSWTDTYSWEPILVSKCFYFRSEKGCTQKETKLPPTHLEANSFLFELKPFQKELSLQYSKQNRINYPQFRLAPVSSD